MPKRTSRPLRQAVRSALYAARRRRQPLPPLPEAVIAAILADGQPPPPETCPGRMPPLPADPEIYHILI